MAKKQDTAQNQTNTFIKGLNKDSNPSFVTEGMWTHARNAVNNTAEGDLGTLSNERSNALCAVAGQTMNGYKYIIGLINLFSDYWIVYTSAHATKRNKTSINSEIGLFIESSCQYFPIVIDPCLNFSKYHLISGASREKEDCTWQVYWADGLNPDRFLNVGDPQTWPISGYTWGGTANTNLYFLNSDPSISIQWPNVQWIQDCTKGNCEFCVDTPFLDCDKIRLARLMETPCLELILGNSAGTLDNGSYFVAMAYTIKGQKVTDYFSPSNIQAIYTLNNSQGSLEVNVSADYENFDEFVLIVVGFINEGVVAKQIGYYSTRTSTIFIDQIKLSSIDVDDFDIVKQTPVFEKSDQITQLNNYLLRIGPTSKFDFNYQPLANLIEAEWVSVEYPSDYYFKGGNKTTYMRDEVYTFFIRWVYDTGDKSASYHIPGRPPKGFEISQFSDDNSLPNDTLLFETVNTASQTSVTSQTLPDGGVVIASGQMGYWQAETEIYPDNRPDIWNSSYHPWTNKFGLPSTDYDLCGLPLRHHLFPDNDLTQNTYHFKRSTTNNSMKIRLMGVRFKNIITPVDNKGNIITNIVGYEILRGSREGNRSVIAKGMINNFRDYNIQGVTANTRTGLYANFPYNCILPPANSSNSSDHNYNYNDPYIKKVDVDSNVQNQGIPREIVSFHSPDTSFRNPFLSVSELKLYGYVSGNAQQQFIEPAGHPKNKLLTNVDFWLMMTYALGYALLASGGKKQINYPQGSYIGQHEIEQSQDLTMTPGTLTPVIYSGAGGTSGTSGTLTTTNFVDNVNNQAGIAMQTAGQTFDAALSAYYATGFIIDGIASSDTLDNIFKNHNNQALNNDATYNPMSYTLDLSGSAMLPAYLKILGGLQSFAFFFSQGLQTAQDFLYAIAPLRQYALQLIGHGYYDKFNSRIAGQRYRFRIEDGFYLINDTNQEIPDYVDTNTGQIKKYTIQNIFRPKLVVLRTSRADSGGTTGPNFLTSGTTVAQQISNALDQSSVTLGMADDLGLGPEINENKKTIQFSTPIASHYASIKVRLKNQYGQLQSIKQQAITPCEQKTDAFGNSIKTLGTQSFVQPSVETAYTTQVSQTYYHKIIVESNLFFGGDSYICRFTEKNPMFMFYNWLYGVADDFEYNYFVNQMLPQARYWMNSQHYDVSNISVEQLSDFLQITNNAAPGQGIFPEDYYQLDNTCYRLSDDDMNPGNCNTPGFLSPRDHYFYTSACGVRDFFVETDVLVDFREVGTFDFEKCYHPYRFTDLQALFKMDPIVPTRGNYYIYDMSLSASRLPSKFLTFGILQNRYYDPLVANLCYTYYPNVITYSLPFIEGSVEDSWFVFLPNNRKDFISQISSVKNFARTGALITFKNDGPQVFQGIDQLQLDASGVKVTVGDGGLFTREPQNLVVTDRPYQYGSSQSRLAVISTPAGIYYVSQNQGKIFTYNEGITEISQSGMKWWFDEFLPSRLLEDFPEYDYGDNPVAGVGCQAIYDNENSVLYFCKKDYKLKTGYNDNPLTPNRIQYVSTSSESYFVDTLDPFQQNKRYDLGDPAIFEDASWTVSYDPKNRFWISFHDWYPDLTLPTKSTIVSTRTDQFWAHNLNCNDYCNFYGTQYPFEIEFPIVTGQTITTLKSVEYVLECYRREKNYCVDQFHVLDYNFDYAVIHNTEQASAYLKLNIYAKNNPPLNLQYPKANPSIQVDPTLAPYPGFDILFSKEENKYRFNQFWDSVFDRGEFPRGAGYPPVAPLVPNSTVLLGNYTQENLWVTQSNGYIKTLNYNNINLNKSSLEHKKFRHYLNFIKLAKIDSRDTNMVLKIFNTKNQYSPR
jgi:hypothetical protein